MDLANLNALSLDDAETTLYECCGASEWVRRMATARPFESADAVLATARDVWDHLDKDDWLEAFAAHPRIGDRDAGGQARSEQAGVADADDATLQELAERTHEYEERFGHVFLVLATGKTAGEMLDLCRARLGNDPETELRIATGEQEKITDLRLRRLLEIG